MKDRAAKKVGYGDCFASREILMQRLLFTNLAIVGVVSILLLSLPLSCSRQPHQEVVVYAAQDRVFAEPILKEFENETGIRVRAIYDSEAVKTVAIVNRLLAERERPLCDVYWGNEELRTRLLAAKGVFRETNGWSAFGYRSRRVVMSETSDVAVPASLLELTNPIYRGRVAMAYPVFGTTATHLLALRQHWGDEGWLSWCKALAANQPYIVDGNSVVVSFVSRGEAALGLTDSDDIAAAVREGASLRALNVNEETLLIPNTVAIVGGAPHPEAAQKLFDYLQTDSVMRRLIKERALEGAVLSRARTLKPDWEALVRDVESGTETLRGIFRR